MTVTLNQEENLYFRQELYCGIVRGVLGLWPTHLVAANGGKDSLLDVCCRDGCVDVLQHPVSCFTCVQARFLISPKHAQEIQEDPALLQNLAYLALENKSNSGCRACSEKLKEQSGIPPRLWSALTGVLVQRWCSSRGCPSGVEPAWSGTVSESPTGQNAALAAECDAALPACVCQIKKRLNFSNLCRQISCSDQDERPQAASLLSLAEHLAADPQRLMLTRLYGTDTAEEDKQACLMSRKCRVPPGASKASPQAKFSIAVA